MIYTGTKKNKISFPLGGIGTGCIGLAGNGRLIDWEIYNRPNKRSLNGFSHFAVKAESEGEILDARVLNADTQDQFIGEFIRGGSPHSGFGFGPESCTMAGMPHFKEAIFNGEYPIAKIQFDDLQFPGEITLNAFNPFIPLNDKDSSIPCAFFEYEIYNSTDQIIKYTICGSSSNPILSNQVVHEYKNMDGIHSIKMSSNQFSHEETSYGDLCIGTDAIDVSYQEFWYRGQWSDALESFWRDFTQQGHFNNRSYHEKDVPSKRNKDMASLAAHVEIPSKETRKIRFVISWNFPNMENYWNPIESREQISFNKVWKNYYATMFEDSRASANYSLTNWTRLYFETKEFKDELFSSTLPDVVIESISANISILKSPTCLRLEDGSFYGFEGCIEDIGCCEGSCTHVWNYAYALPFLFPNLERSMRNLDYKYNQREDGRMSFRLQLPLGRPAMDFHACVDGQFGGVIKSYRDLKISGDTLWLKGIWKNIKKSIEYAWSESNEDQWDLNQDGVMEGRQHHTLDMELFGPNSWLTGFYLTGLKAGSELAKVVGDDEASEKYAGIFEKGKKWMNDHLFNGEFFCQKVDLKDVSLLEKYNGVSLFGDNAKDAYWNDEVSEIKYQIGTGCLIDQVIAQWHSNLCGLGEVFDKDKTQKALKSIYKYNYIPSMRGIANIWRLFTLNDEGGVIICSWPDAKTKPNIPLTYSTETMAGFEYQLASHMIQEGLVEEAISIVKSVRERYDGQKRNPWNEMECGSNYARSMSSYSLLLAFSGFEYDMVNKHIGFNPKVKGTHFKCFWSLESGWGNVEIDECMVNLTIREGSLVLKTFSSDWVGMATQVNSDNCDIEFRQEGCLILLKETLTIKKSSSLIISFKCTERLIEGKV